MSGHIDIDDGDAGQGLTALVLALVEVIHAALKLQAVRRMEAGTLAGNDLERVGLALMALERSLARMQHDLGLAESVRAVRGELDGLVRNLLEPAVEVAEP